MGLCNDWGLPHSEFLQWSVEDRAKAVAFALEKNERCGMCGTAEWEWKENKYAYEAVRHVCFGCQQKDLAREEHDGQQAGVSIVLVPEATARLLRRRKKD